MLRRLDVGEVERQVDDLALRLGNVLHEPSYGIRRTRLATARDVDLGSMFEQLGGRREADTGVSSANRGGS